MSLHVQLFDDSFCNLFSISGIAILRFCKITDNFALPLVGNFAVAQKSCQHLFMSEVLAPRLKILRRFANLLTIPDESISETVWVEVRKPGSNKCIAEYGADG